MHRLSVLLALVVACGAPSGSRPSPTDRRVRIIYRQYRPSSVPLVMENLAGRKLAKLRSRPLKPGEPPVAYVPDDVMEKLLQEFRRLGYFDYAVPRPADPTRLGAKGELTILERDGRARSLLRTPLPRGTTDRKAAPRAKCYVACARNFIAVWNFYHPTLQATAGGAEFKVKRVR